MQPNRSHEAHESGNRPDAMSAEKPLESWKEIAAYLQRNAVTVRRWEREEGLPVHRHRHKSRASVYAYPSELDAWREGRKPEAEPEPGRMALWGSPWSSTATVTLLLLALLWVGNTASGVQAQGLAGVTARQFELSEATLAAGVSPYNVSSDGRYLGAADYQTMNTAIIDVTTGEYRTVSNHNSDGELTEFIDLAAISRDGGRIAAWYYRDGATFGTLRVIDADGGNEIAIYEDPCGEEACEWGEPMDWSPDGDWVLMFLEKSQSLAEGTAEILMVPSNGGEPRVLQSYEYIRRYRPKVQFSPDGKYVAYDYPPDATMAEGDLYVLSVDGGEPVAVASHPAHDRFLSWTPNGDILFESERGTGSGLYQVPLVDGHQSGDPELVHSGVQIQWPFGFGSNETFFYWTRSHPSDAMVGEINLGARQVLVQPVPISERFGGATAFPSFSADGSKAAYLHLTSDRSTIVIRDLVTGDEREILPEIQFDARSRLRWHADGEHLLGLTTHADQNGLYQINVGTGEVELLYPSNDIPFRDQLDWSPDGKYIYQVLSNNAQSNLRLVQLDLQTNAETTLFTSEFSLVIVTLSPDEKKVAFFELNGQGEHPLRVVNTDGSGGEMVLYRMNHPARKGLAWTSDSKNLLFFNRTDPTVDWDLWIAPIDATDGEPQPIGIPSDSRPTGLVIDPNGRVAFTDQRTVDEYWMLENFLPAGE